jgi:hypothetical protein
MKSTIVISGLLKPNDEVSLKLKRSIVVFREMCNFISDIAYNEECFSSAALHHVTYKTVRSKFNVPANFAVRAREKVISIYKKNRKKMHVFKGLNLELDNKLLKLSMNDEVIASITTIESRVKTKLFVDPNQTKYLNNHIIKANLQLRSNQFFLHITFRLDDTNSKLE